MVRQLFQAAQVAQHHFQADVFADGDHLEVHQRTDLLLVIAQRRTHALALLGIEGFHQLVNNVTRQLRSQVGQLVGVHFLGGGEQFVIVHVGDQRLPHGVGHFQQDVAIAIRAHQLPDRQAVFQGQGFEDVGDVGGVQVIELALQLDEVLAVDQVFHQVVVGAFLTVGQVFDHALALQQFDHLGQAVLQAFLRFFYFYFSHRRTPLPAAEHAGRINRSDLSV
ncbi:hypothetical protein D3C76_1104410 [compost metagenome]